ncbi:MAG: Ig-like domain-containing protein [Saprospiraceae bacterium]|nr:Ig-like domain-containing protein [Saprospiraceae bacterium]
MKTLTLLCWITLATTITSQIEATTINMIECSAYKVWFDYPKPHQNIRAGSDLTVRITARPSNHITSVTLYHNGQMVGTDSQFPFRWEHKDINHASLRNLRQGSHKLRIRILYSSGQSSYKDCKFYVVKNGGSDSSPQLENCGITNPLQNLDWLRRLRAGNQKIIIEQYTSGGQTLFKIRYCHKPYLRQWFDCEGRQIGSNRINLVRRAQKVKVLYDGCKLVIKPYATSLIAK